ncbi:MAG TPA: Uma2 family endonuclease [Byssovorax sp.]
MDALANPQPPLPRDSGRRDHVVVLRGIPWAEYDALCRARADTAGPRMAYLDGTLEIMSPSRFHEFDKKLLARLIEAYGEEDDISLNGFGSETYRRKAKEAGVEPDECYCVGDAKPFPDFAIEVVRTSGGVDKLEIYRRLGVPEVWFWIRGEFHVFGLVGRRYVARAKSEVLPRIDLARVAAIVRGADPSKQTEAVKAYRASLRRRR